MSLEYAEKRIKEALDSADGNVVRARQQVIAWTFEDAKLLHALTKSHLTGIVAYHIERVESGRADEARKRAAQAEAVKQAAAKAPASEKATEEDFGMEILKAVAASGADIFGMQGSGRPVKRGAVSQDHIDALKAMTSKSAHPPKRDE